MDQGNFYKDYTLKVRIADATPVVAQLNILDAKDIGIDIQTDTYFKTDKGRLKFRKGTHGSLITHYLRRSIDGVERTTIFRYDVNPGSDDIDALYRSNEIVKTVTKERKIFLLPNVKIHLDMLPNGESFLELEAFDHHNEFTELELRKRCLFVLKELGLNQTSIIPTGYLND